LAGWLQRADTARFIACTGQSVRRCACRCVVTCITSIAQVLLRLSSCSMLGVLVCAGCAANQPAVERSAPARPRSLQCAATLLADLGFRVSGGNVRISGENTQFLGPGHTILDRVTVQQSDGNYIRVRMASTEISQRDPRAGPRRVGIQPTPEALRAGNDVLVTCGNRS
jgi:hypothetical protein